MSNVNLQSEVDSFVDVSTNNCSRFAPLNFGSLVPTTYNVTYNMHGKLSIFAPAIPNGFSNLL